ncbi:undecaprenyl diphosphate synthase [Dethiosulfatibacter aminovorans DSM 17477]|uniref:Isoprenyl transferase n=1 Tax=Dethiosulfatibacter aminovorans DSM 17477 TaxID=1121476 RepID=A0A1M6DEH9_9FIRM|nr:isoprenyl transferase [Dethiosulfatibacter aminovorans]SHI71570.1 undecaprenyl diphosphate synthase [Dethiosulfatibacter aminovorans DSM 17477]
MNDTIDMRRIPHHIAIIMDGNRRWAKRNNKNKMLGHREGMLRIREIVEECVKLGVKSLTVYAFSTENWGREKDEVGYLMNLLIEFSKTMIKPLDEAGVKVNIFGDISELPERSRTSVLKAIERTSNNEKLNFNIALNYGSKTEIARAVRNIARDAKECKLEIDDINEDLIGSYLYSKDQEDPDMIIRTSGEQRLSNFLLYQAAYSEFYFTDVLWPDFTADELNKAIIEYQNRNRRYGKE